MLNGKLRITPTCYHVLHLIPVMSAHEMGFFCDEGLKSDDEAPGYKISSAAPVDLEAMPFPIDGRATGFEDMLAEEEKLGELNYDVPTIADVCAQNLVAEAYKELRERNELKEEFERLSAIAQKWGY